MMEWITARPSRTINKNLAFGNMFDSSTIDFSAKGSLLHRRGAGSPCLAITYQTSTIQDNNDNQHEITQLLLLSCAKSHMLSASGRQPHLLHVSAVDRHQTWSMDKSWRCVTLSGFLHSHIVHCRWNPISCGTHYSGPGLSKNDSAVITDVCEDQNREVGLWGLPLKWNWPP